MMKVAALCALPVLALAGIDYTQEQSHGSSDWKTSSNWECGHTVGTSAHNSNAGVVAFQDGSLDHVRLDTAEVIAITDVTQLARVQTTSFSDLFCYEYIKRYQNPMSESNLAGVCIRNMTVGQKWISIMDADDEVRAAWEEFGTDQGYQRSTAKYKEQEDDFNNKWGSGRSGSNPSNWCSAYMKDMMCHVAFPQFADENSALTTASGLGALVRPICSADCESVMDICNRHEPDPYTGVFPSWLQGFETEEEDLDNNLYCKAWNKGYHLARAGTGVASGDDDTDAYCATFDSSSSAAPAMLLTLLASVLFLFF